MVYYLDIAVTKLFENSLFKQIVSYGLIGVCCSLIDVVVFSFLVYFCSINEYIANIFSVICGLTVSFFCNRKLTFKVSNHIAMRYISFFTIGMLGLLLSEGVLYILGSINVSAIIAKLISVVVVGIFQFICNKLISFRTRHESELKQ